MQRNFNLEHLHLRNVNIENFKSPRTNPTGINIPERKREEHVLTLRKELNELKNISKIKNNKESTLVTFSGKENFNLKTDSIGNKKTGIEVLVEGEKDNIPFAVARIPNKGFGVVEKKLEDYQYKNNTKTQKPKNNDFVASIENIRLTLLEELYVGHKEYWEKNKDQRAWWEIWILGGSFDLQRANENIKNFTNATLRANLSVDLNKIIQFAERQVLLLQATRKELEILVDESDVIAEIHNPSRVILQEMSNNGPDSFNIEELVKSLKYPSEEAPRVTVIDTGVANQHPLLESLFPPNSLHSIDPLSPSTGDTYGHGTEVAGIAAFGDITDILNSDINVELTHHLESVKIPLGEAGTEELWGGTTLSAVDVVESSNPNYKRIFNMSIGATHDYTLNGKPTSWSAAVDSICYNEGYGRLMTVAAGNVQPIDKTGYPFRNLATEIDDPGQALNAITVGGYTKLIESPPLSGDYEGYEVLVTPEGLSPHSKTGPARFAIKPEVVFEAGNVLVNNPMWEDNVSGLSLLSTSNNFFENLFVNTAQTSMAAPQAAKMLAAIWSCNLQYLPSTIRGLLIHSASWNEQLIKQFPDKIDRLRACGYGIPNLEFACRSATSAVTLIAEDKIQIGYEKQVKGKKTIVRDMNFYKIPWPEEVLLELGSTEIELRVTLSFFIEPNPKHYRRAYEGASLSWELQGPTESDEEFFKRVNKERREEKEKGFRSGINWEIGSAARNRGTVQSDRWKTTAAELATCGYIAIYPRHGWWKDKVKERPNPSIDYSLIVSVITNNEEINIYIPIENKISVDIDW